jgi:hypothetical protein
MFALRSAIFALVIATALAVPTVELGTAGNYAILSQTGISTVPTSAITGDIAVSPITAAAITGFSLVLDSDGTKATCGQVTGTVYAAGLVAPTPSLLTTAVGFMETAYTDAAGRTNTDAARIQLGAGKIGGVLPGGPTDPLTPGVYTWSTGVNIDSDLVLSGSNTDIFILQVAGNVNVASGKKMILEGGALPENIFWQVAGLVVVGTTAHMEGIFLVKTSAAFMTGSSLNGRILAQTAVTLDSTTITP